MPLPARLLLNARPMPKHPAEIESDFFCDLLAETMTDKRKETGLSKSQVATNSHVSPQMVGYVETKIRRPGIDIFVRIVRGKGLLPSEVMAETEKRAGWTREPGGELVFTSVK
jgi:hypothetical protein